MVQVLPLECWNDCVDQLEAARKHARQNEAPDGIGWTRMYNVQAGPASLPDLAIPIADVRNLIPLVMRPARFAATGTYSGPEERLERTSAYNSGNNLVLLSWSEDELWSWLSFSAGPMNPWRLGPLVAFFHRLSTLAQLLLVDWREGNMVDLSDNKAIVQYLKGT